jgi:release factor glutamine methyltransferase
VRTARLDAELLLCRATKLDRIGLYVGFDRPLNEAERADYRELVKKRLAGEPVAYLLGEQEFWSIALEVNPAVLIPRQETEHVVEESLRELPSEGEGAGLVVVDVGTGSGAIALALKKERPAARVIAIDASAEALAVATRNAARHGLELELVEGDLLSPLEGRGEVDLIASNPPYVESQAIDKLAPEVRREPRAALDGGPDGLAVLRRLIADASARLRKGGALVVEMGAGQDGALATMCRENGAYEEPRLVKDLAGIVRVLVVRRK